MSAWTNFKLNKVLKADLQVLLAAFFFGIGFLGQRAVSVHGLGTMTCNAFRFGLSTAILIACMPFIPPNFFASEPSEVDEEGGNIPIVVINKSDDEDENLMGAAQSTTKGERDLTLWLAQHLLGPYASYARVLKNQPWFWGILLGFINFGASGFQQWGISMTSASKCAFIAGFDLFLTPIFSLFIPTFKRNGKPKPSTWLAVGTSLIGLYLLSGSRLDEFEVGTGEILAIISTVFWTLHITYTDIATTYVDSLTMMVVQFTVVTLLSTFTAMLTESQQLTFEFLLTFLPTLIFLAISEGLAFILMALGQNFSPPTHAAILLSLEGVFAAIASFFILGEVLSTRELLGCFLMLLSTFIAKIGCGSLENVMLAYFSKEGALLSDGKVVSAATIIKSIQQNIGLASGSSNGGTVNVNLSTSSPSVNGMNSNSINNGSSGVSGLVLGMGINSAHHHPHQQQHHHHLASPSHKSVGSD